MRAMQTLHRHLQKTFLVTFLSTVLVITFVMTIGGIFKVTVLLAKGVPWKPILDIFVAGLPAAFSFSMPLSALMSSLLMFGRLSSDSEISAMKSCGISMWQVVNRPVLIGIALSIVGFFINNELAPRGHYAQRSAISRLGMESPIKLLEEGRFVQDFDGMSIYVGRRRDNQLTDVRIYDLRKAGITREIKAQTGVVVTNTPKELVVQLRNVRVNPFMDDRPGEMFCERWTIRVPNPLAESKYRSKPIDMPLVELSRKILRPHEAYPELNAEDLAKQTSAMKVELHKRMALSLSSLTFILLGIPLGTRSHRKESSIGIAWSLGLAALFYAFIITSQSLAKHPALYPHWINWIPVVISFFLGLYLLHRSN